MPNTPTRRRAWLAAVVLCAITVAGALGAAFIGLAARDAIPPDTQGPPAATTEEPVPSSFSEPLPTGATLVATAEFKSLDASTRGTAVLLDVDNGKLLRLASFDTEPGDGYVLYLVPRADARSPGDGVLLGPLKGAAGEQNYAVPTGVRTDGPLTVLVWSRGFKGPVAHAVLRR